MLIGAAVAICLFGYDATSTIRWGGGKDIALIVKAPHPVRSVLYADTNESMAEHFRALPLKAWETMLQADASPKPAPRRPDGTFELFVRSYGTESGLRILHNTRGQMTYAVLVVELETSEKWVAILKLPDTRKYSTVTLRIPEDAHSIGLEVAPAPRPTVGK